MEAVTAGELLAVGVPLRGGIGEMQLFRREMIPRLCEESGRWVVISSEAGDYRVRNADGRATVYINVYQRPGTCDTLFQANFPIRFSLEREPAGLFARVLMRNFSLKFSSWMMYIGESCEACLILAGRVPTVALEVAWFQ
jgi:hypothetical protein